MNRKPIGKTHLEKEAAKRRSIRSAIGVVANSIARASILLALALVVACGADELRWSEDVVLADGRVVTLRRVQHFDKGDYVGAHSFEFDDPTTKNVVKWQSDGFFRLVALFVVNGTPHILVKPTFGGHDERAGCPYPRTLIYKYINDRWLQIPYAASPVKRVDGNVTIDPKADRDYIKSNNGKLQAGRIRVRTDTVLPHEYGLYLDQYPTQVFQCPQQKRVDLQ